MGVSNLWPFGSTALELAPPWGDYNFLRWEPGRAMAAHGHRFLQAIHVLEGGLTVDWGDGPRRLGPGDVHVLPPGGTHALRTDKGHAQFGANFSEERDPRGLLRALLEAFPRPIVLHVPFAEHWRSRLGRPGPAPLDRLRRLAALDDYALTLVEHCGRSDSAAEPLLELLRINLAEAPSVEELAGRLCTSRATLQRLARRHFGCGVAHLHERLRMEAAARDLLLTDRQVSECARERGYADVYHFSRAFKRVFGLSPAAYRRERRGALG